METLKKIVEQLRAFGADLYDREPVIINNALTTVVVAGLAIIGVTVDVPTGLLIVGLVLPALLGTKVTRDTVYSPAGAVKKTKRAVARAKRQAKKR